MSSIYHEPWELVPNQIRGAGGREIDRFRGIEPALDYPEGSEAWIGSTTHVAAPPEGRPYWGCSEVLLPDGRREFLFKVFEEAPEEILGKKHLERNGKGMGVLVKFLDAQKQYGLQCHPTREWAKARWGQDHGKAESWYVIGTREDTAEPAYILLGFKEGVTREMWEKPYHEGNEKELEKLCHKFEVHEGDAFFLGGGLPHALGEGCFVIEVQEPQDITLGWYNYELAPLRKKFDVDEKAYDERLLGAYHFDGCTQEENLKRWKSSEKVFRKGEWGREVIIVGPEQTGYFSFTRLTLEGCTELYRTGYPQIGIVLKGEGKLTWRGGEKKIRKGMELFFPADISDLKAEGTLDMVLCNPEGALE